MGYAGYVPAKYASKLTPKQAALKDVANEASYELMGKVVRNVVSAAQQGFLPVLASIDACCCRGVMSM